MASYLTIPTKKVYLTGGGTDTYVELNPNAPGDGNVRAFCAMFKGAAETVKTNCNDLPINVTLAIWGGESLWAAGTTQRDNQNWGNIIYSSSKNPPNNIGKGTGGWAKYPGKTTYAKGFAGYLKLSTYKSLTEYLTYCKSRGETPESDTCLREIANSGYNGSDADSWYKGMVSFKKSVDTALKNL